MKLIEINKENIGYYKQFDQAYHETLSEFQSRIYPDDGSELIYWYYIKAYDKIIGSVWLEKKVHELCATLGIFIAAVEYRGKGIGKQVIQQIIDIGAKRMQIDEIRLNVRETNVRAIKCYTDLGFIEFKRYKKENNNVISTKFQL